MNPKKQKVKDRRRARKLAEEAWEAVHQGNLDLAEKIIRRAVAAQADNPVFWNDQGAVLSLRQKDAEEVAGGVPADVAFGQQQGGGQRGGHADGPARGSCFAAGEHRIQYTAQAAPEWRNWQTRQVEGLVALTGSAGSSPVSGIVAAKGFTSNEA